jgi:GTP cyclohydrolase I
VAYIPKDRVLGLSKMPRVVEYFSRRPQIQERLTEQVYHALQYILGTDDIAVTIMAEHMCVSQRGVEDNSASTTTSKLGGCFKTDLAVRTEFFKHVYQ